MSDIKQGEKKSNFLGQDGGTYMQQEWARDAYSVGAVLIVR
jgi:hypothetical protein